MGFPDGIEEPPEHTFHQHSPSRTVMQTLGARSGLIGTRVAEPPDQAPKVCLHVYDGVRVCGYVGGGLGDRTLKNFLEEMHMKKQEFVLHSGSKVRFNWLRIYFTTEPSTSNGTINTQRV